MPAASLKIIHNTYRDSVSLMQLSAKIAALSGVHQASVVMATEGNLDLLREAGLLDGEVAASPSDLLVVLRAESEEAARLALEETERALAGGSGPAARGRGPQMGFILRRSELALHEVIPVPMDYAGADLQGALGYMFVKALRNEFRRRGLKREAAVVVTQVRVDLDDPGFRNPTKPIGSPMDQATARKRATDLGWQVKEDPGRGWRRVVPSPKPKEIVDLEVIRHLVGEGYVVVACGGGGIPVIRDAQGDLHGVEAVIDKDTASSLLARALGADRLVVATGVERVALDYGKPTQRWLDRLTLAEAKKLYDADQFDQGSMGPKIAAVIQFLEGGGAEGIITDPPHLAPALAGKAGTRIVPG